MVFVTDDKYGGQMGLFVFNPAARTFVRSPV